MRYDSGMRIVGHGIDIVKIARIARLCQEHEQRFVDRVFTSAERRYAEARKKRWFEHLAGRFAAKEAIFKVLGTGWTGGIAWCDAEIVPDISGKPTVKVYGRCREVAQAMGINQWWVSISHTDEHATASAIGVDAGAP